MVGGALSSVSGMSNSCDLADITDPSDPASLTRLRCSDIPSKSCKFQAELSGCMHACTVVDRYCLAWPRWTLRQDQARSAG